MRKTTDLKSLKAGDSFTWGAIVKWHEVGDYTIAEFHPYILKDGRMRGVDDSKLEFHGWIKGKDLSRGWDSLDAALVGCIAYSHEGCNHGADAYFMKMISVEK